MLDELETGYQEIENEVLRLMETYVPEYADDWKDAVVKMAGLSIVERTKLIDDVATHLLQALYPDGAMNRWRQTAKELNHKVSPQTLNLFQTILPWWYISMESERTQ